MQRVQLYIEGELVDLFQDETIELTSTIQDIRDIGKVFTDYSQNFNVPASDTNNKIFRHYYNYHITGNAYDSRKKKQAELYINYMPFRRGKVFLNGVKMKMNKPYSYDLTFYGNTVSLKDLIGDDELTDLTYLSNYNHEYSNTVVKGGFTSGLDLNSQTDSIIYPLITSKKRLFYNSDSPSVAADVLDSDGNLYRGSSSTTRGLKFTDLKPAIRTIHIIEAIESQYGVTFTRDFFDSTAFSNLYMWINNKKGEYNELDDNEPYLFSYDVTGYTYSSGDAVGASFDGSTITINQSGNPSGYIFDLDIDVANATTKYKVEFKNLTTGETIEKNLVDDVTALRVTFQSTTARQEDVIITISSQDALTINSINVGIEKIPLIGAGNLIANYTTDTNQDTVANIDLEQRLPKLKVIDFLSGLFKMFNLTAYYIDDRRDADFGKIYVDTLDNFYSDAVNNPLDGLIDIDKYLDVTEHQVNSTLPFTDIEFKYEETNTVFMEHHFEQFNEVFGNAEYNVRRNFPDQIDRGTKYEIQLPFSHMKYERINDTSLAGGITDIQWGYCATGEFNATDDTIPKGDYDTTTIKPLLFYGINQTSITTDINWLYDNGGTPASEPISNYWRPSNSNDEGDATTAPSYSLNFDQEFDEWQTINYGDDTNSLYEIFYKNYVEGVFNVAKRLFVITAYLPPSILVNYRMNDQIKIQDKVFRINSITTNLNTGKTKLELLNIFSNEIVE